MAGSVDGGFVDVLDVGVFCIPSATSGNDRQSLLRIQGCVRDRPYCYLEVGSELGGSLVPHLADPQCTSVYSVDLRVSSQADERAETFHYPEDGEKAMVDLLTDRFDERTLRKLKIFRCDVSQLCPEDVPGKPDLALIDAEHTNVACFSDAVSVFRLVGQDAIISFHDANLIADAIQNFELMLRSLGMRVSTVFLPDCVAAIGIGAMSDVVTQRLQPFSLCRDEYLADARKQRWKMVARSMIAANEV
jgi:Methyltransferase domain